MTHCLVDFAPRRCLAIVSFGIVLAGFTALNPSVASPPAPVPSAATLATNHFTDNGNGTVTDRLTGLIWLKNANCFDSEVWTAALAVANGLASGACGLSDGSTAGQWRLPNRKELQSLLDPTREGPALPAGHPFTGVQFTYYWSSTSDASDTSFAWGVDIDGSGVYLGGKTGGNYVWPVRGDL